MIHILDDEKNFFAQVNEQLDKVENNGKIFLTKFLSLREQLIIEESVKYRNLNVAFNGGYVNAERKRCLIYHKDLNFSHQFNIVCFRIRYNKRYLTLTHQNVLGTLMSLQIDRSLFGDIIFIEDDCFLFTVKEIEPILLQEFRMINRVPITIETYDLPIIYEQKYDTMVIITSSLRIDSIISHVYRLSREKAKKLILDNMVYLNFNLVTNASAKCEEMDIVSVRKKGRFIVSSILRKTKANKIALEIKIPTS